MLLILVTLTILCKVIQGSSNSSASDFKVLTDECQIPSFPVFSNDTNFQRQNYTSCTNNELLTFTRVEKDVATLSINKLSFMKYEKQLNCCFSYITRNGSEEEPDVGISTSDCINFNETVQLQEEGAVLVKCDNDSDVVYINVHNPITITEPVKKRLQKQPIGNSGNAPLSVLIIVIDSVSRLNFDRAMPLTRTVLLKNNFNDFLAYNKVDDNTFPNAMALLSGMTLRQVYSSCHPGEVGNLDKCPLIWYQYRDLGYVTAYAEDWAEIATFNFQRKGFREPPTDYYFKPYIEAAEKLKITVKDGMPYCSGPETEGERILNLAKEFAVTLKGKPSFGIFWMNTFSHNNISSPSGMDEKVANFFKELRKKGILEESLVMLLSDHGIRFGKFRQTIQGWFEERLPLNFISVPKKFQKKYSREYKIFLNNTNKLISTYDVYMTLQDVLKKSVPNYNISASLGCPKCQSLFSDIPLARSCRDAGIPEAWCTCVGEFTMNDPRITEETNNKAARLALSEIRRLEYRKPCSNSVTKILSSAVNLNRLRKSYLLIVLETNCEMIYQVFFRIRGDPVEFVRIVKAMRLQ